jgi:antitoxin VapB
VSISDAVAYAISERIERVKNEDLAETLMRIGRDCAKRWKEPYKSMDIDDLLYDENGLPK